jgi:hypothetical protein
MNVSFKAFMQKPWTLKDDRIVIKGTEILLSEISKVEHSPLSPGNSNGVISIYHDKNFLGFNALAYPSSQKEEGEKAAKYILAAVGGKNPDEAVKKYEDQQQNGYRKLCKVCGHIFCYTQEDLDKNKKLIYDATYERGMGKTEWWTTSMVTGNQRQQRADELEAKIVDYNRCPKCGSKELVDATDEDIAKSKEPQSAVIQQASSADELKKFKDLLDAGVITQEEFDAKKKQLLGL